MKSSAVVCLTSIARRFGLPSSGSADAHSLREIPHEGGSLRRIVILALVLSIVIPAGRARCATPGLLAGGPLAPWQRRILETAHKGDATTLSLLNYRSTPGTDAAEDDGAWTHLFTLARFGHTAIYDPVRDRMVVFGGDDGYYPYFTNAVSVLSLSGTPTWTELTPAGTPPSERVFSSAIYDPKRDRMLVLGGYDGTGSGNDLWALSLSGTPTWSKLDAASPEPINGTAIYDPVRDRMVIVEDTDEIWALSLSGTPAWTEIVPAGTLPAKRYGFAAIYDPVRDRIVLFGGENDDYPNPTETWALSMSGTPTWTELAPGGTRPVGRRGHSAIYDPVGDRMVIFGGNDVSYGPLDDAWALSLSGSTAWTELAPGGAGPQHRVAHTAIYDPMRHRMLVFGGYDNIRRDEYYNDVWGLSLSPGSSAWTQVPGPSPTQRARCTAVYDSVRDRMLVFGGTSKHHGINGDVWALSLSEPRPGLT
jgi:hypothetical protein